jgi:hypothetical protein
MARTHLKLADQIRVKEALDDLVVREGGGCYYRDPHMSDAKVADLLSKSFAVTKNNVAGVRAEIFGKLVDRPGPETFEDATDRRLAELERFRSDAEAVLSSVCRRLVAIEGREIVDLVPVGDGAAVSRLMDGLSNGAAAQASAAAQPAE